MAKMPATFSKTSPKKMEYSPLRMSHVFPADTEEDVISDTMDICKILAQWKKGYSLEGTLTSTDKDGYEDKNKNVASQHNNNIDTMISGAIMIGDIQILLSPELSDTTSSSTTQWKRKRSKGEIVSKTEEKEKKEETKKKNRNGSRRKTPTIQHFDQNMHERVVTLPQKTTTS